MPFDLFSLYCLFYLLLFRSPFRLPDRFFCHLDLFPTFGTFCLQLFWWFSCVVLFPEREPQGVREPGITITALYFTFTLFSRHTSPWKGEDIMLAGRACGKKRTHISWKNLLENFCSCLHALPFIRLFTATRKKHPLSTLPDGSQTCRSVRKADVFRKFSSDAA